MRTSTPLAAPAPADDAFLRVKQITGDPKATPPLPGLLPISRSTFLAGVAAGRFPAGIRLTSGVVVWRRSALLALLPV